MIQKIQIVEMCVSNQTIAIGLIIFEIFPNFKTDCIS